MHACMCEGARVLRLQSLYVHWQLGQCPLCLINYSLFYSGLKFSFIIPIRMHIILTMCLLLSQYSMEQQLFDPYTIVVLHNLVLILKTLLTATTKVLTR